jgi:hypothetical protein
MAHESPAFGAETIFRKAERNLILFLIVGELFHKLVARIIEGPENVQCQIIEGHAFGFSAYVN